MRRRAVSRRFVAAMLAAAAAGAFAQDAPITSFPYTPGLDVSSMDRTADPCSDFYQYACGGWLRNNPIPPDQSSWSVYGKLYQDNQRFLWGILDSLAKGTEGRNATQQKIGDYFAACMDEAAVEKLGARPLAPYLARIDGMKDKRDLGALLGELHLDTGDRELFFGIGSNQDFESSTSVIAFAAAGGLGLPDRDYYTKDDARSQEIRGKYVAHMTRVFQLLGDGPQAAARNAGTVMEMETALARASLTRVEKRDPYNLFHKMDGKAVRALTPAFDWDGYLGPLGLSGVDTFNLTEPGFFKAFDREIENRSLDDIKTYLRWHMAKQSSPFLSPAFVNENFDFFGRTLRGVPELRPRWKRCVTLVDEQLGEALGQEFVARAFSPKLKDDTVRMTRRIEQAMRDDIRSLTWMSDATRKRALEKLDTIVNKIGYPDKWRDYSSVEVRRDDFFGNVQRAQRFESKRDLAKIGQPLDRGEWHMSPPTVNAYYDAQLNDINFPAGVLQPPLYDPKMDDAPNYGDTGGTIGHELTHGFDDEGRKFDAQGNLKDWWTAEDAKAFTARAQCIVDQYAQYVIVDDIRINSELTLGEDVADIGGLILAWMAWKAEVADKNLVDRDGLNPEQRFFVGYAQWACENQRPENLRVKALTDPHSPGKYRVNGLVVNMPEFEKAFSCKAGSPMVSGKRCRVW
ncbi:MAG TPA: M13 family metallopeptidase [Usitatibacter sp.]|nr:M13 family metallopeptidase [Usitatibacter sp.]